MHGTQIGKIFVQIGAMDADIQEQKLEKYCKWQRRVYELTEQSWYGKICVLT